MLPVKTANDIPEELRYLGKYMWAPFQRFCTRLPAPEPTVSGMWTMDELFAGASWAFPDLGVLIYGVNTSADSMDHFSNTPSVNPDVIRKLENAAESPGATDVILPRLLLAHHSLGSTTSGPARANNEAIASLRKALATRLNVRVFLTGHVHEEIAELIQVDGKCLLFIGAGSAGIQDGAASGRRPLQYNIVNLRPRGEVDNSPDRVTVYSRVSLDHEFVANPKCQKRQYRWDETSGWVAE